MTGSSFTSGIGIAGRCGTNCGGGVLAVAPEFAGGLLVGRIMIRSKADAPAMAA